MNNKNELITVIQMYKLLEEQIKKGNSDKFVFVNEYYLGITIYDTEDKSVSFDGIHVQDVMDYEDKSGDKILDE